MMDERQVFVLADRTLEQVVGTIELGQYGMVMPASFMTRTATSPPTLREVVNYHAYDDAWVPDMLAGRSMAEVGEDKYRGDLLGDDPATRFSQLVGLACQAAEELEDLDRTVHCSFGDFKAREYLWQVNLFRGLRAYDIATALGLPFDMPATLVEGVWEEVSPHAEEWRSYGVFPPAVAVPDDAPLLDRLLGLTGRQPTRAA